ncbi:MAG: HD-GYP domain-containing protein [Candidatus Zixiibacteriota bacterium]|nr:MAG: HD-GYP domain-containing protein [candidate division Zixibacteria bacterium]
MLEATIQRLQEKLKDSHLKKIVIDAVADMLAIKPSDVRAEEYITAAAVIIVRELKNELLKSEQYRPHSLSRSDSVPDIDCETIINGLLVGMHHDLLESNLQMVRALGSAIAERDYGTSEHNYRVTLYATGLGEHLGLDKAQMQGLIKGSFLHDIGKIGIRDKTLLKPGGLTQREYEDVKRHVTLGTQIIANVRWLEDAVDVIHYHHERWDGTGYPDGLRGEAIPLKARVFCIADVFDALTSERPYKGAMPFTETIEAMAHEKNAQFDPALLTKFIEISEHLYRSVTGRAVVTLENSVLALINRYFQFSPEVEDLRNSFGSIVQPDNNQK